MRRLGNTYSIGLFLVTVLLWTSCVRSPRQGDEGADGSESGASDRSRFDPLDLPVDMTVVPQKYPKAEPAVGRIAFVGGDTSQAAVAPAESRAAAGPDSLAGQAYKVQLFTDKVYGSARRALRVAEEIFDRPVSLDYEVPYFKLRVGSFATRDEADQYVLRAKAAGYQDAWVVVVNVNTRTPALRYRNERSRLESADSLFDDVPGGVDEKR